ncbi:MAG TPA: dipeptidase [Acidobacteriota bacterium]|nr:dipeptidase [Acidobacteriota bacterium]
MSEDQLKDRAGELARSIMVIDTHVDIPYRLNDEYEDISQRTQGGHFDYPRAKEGGLDVPFMSIYIPATYQETGGAKEFADELIDMVEGFQEQWPDKYEVAYSPDDVERIFKAGKIALPMGMENGAPVEGDLANLRHFKERGIRYITLTHSRVNHISDSSYDLNRKWKGLSDFGKTVVEEMNRLGVMVDVSHISDDAFYQVMEISRAPVIASHSSCRHFTPDWERNMGDEMIEKLAEKGGVIQINFGSAFLRAEFLQAARKRDMAISNYLDENELDRDDPKAVEWIAQYDEREGVPKTHVTDVADHIDHVRDLVGIEHVGLGSDFDGVSSLPVGLEDASQLPNLFAELLKRGYSEDDLRKIASENTLRVWRQVEKVAEEMQSAPSN